MYNPPKISIVTPSFNQAAFVRETIESVLSQEGRGKDFELEYVVLDGGSTDGSAEIIAGYAGDLDWWCSEPDRGQSHAINKGFARCGGEVFGWVNSDDVLLPGTLAAVARRWRDVSPRVLVGRGRKLGLNGEVQAENELRETYTKEMLLDWRANYFMQPACFFSREAWEDAEGLDETLEYGMDVDLWLKMAERGPFRSLDRLLAEAKAHDAAKTTGARTRALWFVQVAQVLQKHGGFAEASRDLATYAEQSARLRSEVKTAAGLPILGYAFRLAHRIARDRLARADRAGR